MVLFKTIFVFFSCFVGFKTKQLGKGKSLTVAEKSLSFDKKYLKIE